MKFLSATVIFLATAACATKVKGQKEPASFTSTTIDSFIQRQMQQSGIVGLAAAIIVNKKQVWSKGYGYADRESKKPFTPETIMNIGSISKTFTGVCLMRAVEEGRLSLDEDINNYLPFRVVNPNFPNEVITLRHLATHTSGLADRYPFYNNSTYFYGGATPEPLGDFLRNYFLPGGKHYSDSNFLRKKPGTYRDYSNIAAGLAGYIVELRTGKKLGEYARRHIFRPLKMVSSGWSLSGVDTNRHTRLYSKQGDSVKSIQWYEGTTYPDGGVRTTVNDLSRFFISLLNDGTYKHTRILKKNTVNEMLRFQFTQANKPENVDPDKLNSGIFWATKAGATRIGHNGSDPGVRTFMLSGLDKEIGVILFVNTSLGDEGERTYFDIYNALYKYAAGFTTKTAGSR